MESVESNRTPLWFRVIAVLALLWNVLGSIAVVMQLLTTEEGLSQLPVDQQEFFRSTPLWVHAAALVAVIGGVLGCVGLIAGKRWSIALLGASLVGVIAQQSWMYLASDMVSVIGLGSIALPTLILAFAIGLLILSMWAAKKGWIR